MKRIFVLFLFFSLLGCATLPIHENLQLPPGKIEDSQFIGIRYPFKVTIPPHWTMTTDFPDFLKELGYEEPNPSDREMTELYIYNPSTRTTLQIDFTPASPKAKFSQEKIEAITTAAAGSLIEEMEKDYGKEVRIEIGPTIPFSLKGVNFAAKKYATYTLHGLQWERGWIYGFSEPYQIFILYITHEQDDSKDREDMKKILESFEVFKK